MTGLIGDPRHERRAQWLPKIVATGSLHRYHFASETSSLHSEKRQVVPDLRLQGRPMRSYLRDRLSSGEDELAETKSPELLSDEV